MSQLLANQQCRFQALGEVEVDSGSVSKCTRLYKIDLTQTCRFRSVLLRLIFAISLFSRCVSFWLDFEAKQTDQNLDFCWINALKRSVLLTCKWLPFMMTLGHHATFGMLIAA